MESNSRLFKAAAYEQIARVGKALASEARLEILDALAQGPRTVEALSGQLERSVANTSHHLQTLRRGRLVQTRRDGLYVEYSLAGPDVAALVDQLHAVAARHLADLERLSRDFFEERDGLEPIDRETLLDRLRRDDVVLIDVRPEREFHHGHIPGAVSMPLDQLQSRLNELPSGKTVVAYCRGPLCAFSADAAKVLRERGYDAVRTDTSVSAWAASAGATG